MFAARWSIECIYLEYQCLTNLVICNRNVGFHFMSLIYYRSMSKITRHWPPVILNCSLPIANELNPYSKNQSSSGCQCDCLEAASSSRQTISNPQNQKRTGQLSLPDTSLTQTVIVYCHPYPQSYNRGREQGSSSCNTLQHPCRHQ